MNKKILMVIKDILLSRSKENPDKVFIIHNHSKITFKQFDVYVNKIASYFDSEYKKKYLCLSLNNKIFLLASLLAANRINKIPILSLNRENIQSVFDSLKNHWDGFDILIHSIAYAPRELLDGEYLKNITKLRIKFLMIY